MIGAVAILRLVSIGYIALVLATDFCTRALAHATLIPLGSHLMPPRPHHRSFAVVVPGLPRRSLSSPRPPVIPQGISSFQCPLTSLFTQLEYCYVARSCTSLSFLPAPWPFPHASLVLSLSTPSYSPVEMPCLYYGSIVIMLFLLFFFYRGCLLVIKALLSPDLFVSLSNCFCVLSCLHTFNNTQQASCVAWLHPTSLPLYSEL